MRVITVRNVNYALPKGLQLLQSYGIGVPSRAGDTIEVPEPVSTVYLYPRERVLFDPLRDANPFFHFMESLWMLAGRCDLEWIAFYNKRMRTFSDDGHSLPASYGHRWRHYFHIDQLEQCRFALKADPGTRRAVLQMWSAEDLTRTGSKDLPCNLAVHFLLRSGQLNMTVFNRSNDIVWGAYGANGVQMSMLQEWMAGQVGAQVGTYTQVSDSFHAYRDWYEKLLPIIEDRWWDIGDLYQSGRVQPYPMFSGDEWRWNDGLIRFIGQDLEPRIAFFVNVAVPMREAWRLYKQKQLGQAYDMAMQIAASDWRTACCQWLERRMKGDANP